MVRSLRRAKRMTICATSKVDAVRRTGIWSGASRRRPGRVAMDARPRLVTRSFAPLVAAVGVALALEGCGQVGDDLFCDGVCGTSTEEWGRMVALANLGAPPADPTDAVWNLPAAQTLGQAFYFDARFSGVATQVDALGRPAAVARAPKGQALNISCASCHDLGRAGVDVASTPGNVSEGAGWTDVNALATVNSAYAHLFFWNGRADSLWALAAAVAESPTTMNGNRLHTAWVIADLYRDQYDAIFASGASATPRPLPIPASTSACAIQQIVDASGASDGECGVVGGACAPECRRDEATGSCWPRFPLNGKPGTIPGCQPGDAREPFGDAYDCMDPADQKAIDWVLVNWAKTLEAFEYVLTSTGSAFDQFIADGPRSSLIDESARRGAQLFVGKASCIDCHATPLLTDGAFHDIGVAQVGPDVPTVADCIAGAACDCVAGKKCLPWGEFDGLTRLAGDAALGVAGSKMLRTSIFSDDPGDTSRAADVARAPTAAMKGAWRTPSLRNVALTAPYMHDGRYATLEDVVAHYNRGGDPDAVGTRDVRIKPLLLTDDEQTDLVAFLRTLTGRPLPTAVSTAPTLPPTAVCP
jgi:cytochrome c peroxidase